MKRLKKNRHFAKIYKWLIWVTNNEYNPRHEIEFDAVFFIVNTICLICGAVYFITTKEYGWLGVLLIEYNWALDNMRHNRS